MPCTSAKDPAKEHVHTFHKRLLNRLTRNLLIGILIRKMAGKLEERIVYKGDIPIDSFLEKNQPSKIELTGVKTYVAVRARDPKRRLTVFKNSTTLLEEWERRTRNPKRITPHCVHNLAKKYGYLSGKWLVYCAR